MDSVLGKGSMTMSGSGVVGPGSGVRGPGLVVRGPGVRWVRGSGRPA